MLRIRRLPGGLLALAALLPLALATTAAHADGPALGSARCFDVVADLTGRSPQGDAGCNRPTLDKAIADAKMKAALAHSAFLDGKATRAQVDAYEQWLRALTGEAPRQMVPLSTPAGFPDARNARTSSIQVYFWPYQQVTSWYCGPATAESILRFLGPATSKTANPDGKFDRLTGKPEDDQSMLAGDFWLATDKYHGTYWGQGYMPFTLNAWRGTRWYIQSATPNLEGGTLTKDQALAAIKFDTDRSYPVAENVLYSAATYYPAGFWPGVTYEHWDTVYGHYENGGRQVVQVGQVYHDERLPYDRFQDVDWDTHWSAIGNWYGLVW